MPNGTDEWSSNSASVSSMGGALPLVELDLRGMVSRISAFNRLVETRRQNVLRNQPWFAGCALKRSASKTKSRTRRKFSTP